MTINSQLSIAVILDQAPKSGGAYYQMMNAVLQLNSSNLRNKHNLLYFSTTPLNVEPLDRLGINVKLIQIGLVQRLCFYLRNKFFGSEILIRFPSILGISFLDKFLLSYGVDIVYFTSPTGLAASLEALPYISTVWDLCHRMESSFPEVREKRIFEYREKKYCTILPKAEAILVDSEFSKKALSFYYRVDLDRIYVYPFSPSPFLAGSKSNKNCSDTLTAVKFKYENYILYPAQFWPHKNHVYIIKALHHLSLNSGLEIMAVLPGAQKGPLQNTLIRYIQDMNLEHLFLMPGFVDDGQMQSLYLNSLALVMPSFFGPTNLPVYEAQRLGVPVFYSDLPGFADILTANDFKLDLSDYRCLSKLLLHYYDELKGKRDKRMHSKNQESSFDAIETPNISAVDALDRIFNRFCIRSAAWKPNQQSLDHF